MCIQLLQWLCVSSQYQRFYRADWRSNRCVLYKKICLSISANSNKKHLFNIKMYKSSLKFKVIVSYQMTMKVLIQVSTI